MKSENKKQEEEEVQENEHSLFSELSS